jgi:hypothetical protein
MICIAKCMEHKEFPCLLFLQNIHVHFSIFTYMKFQTLLVSIIHKYSTFRSCILGIFMNEKLQGCKVLYLINIIHHH